MPCELSVFLAFDPSKTRPHYKVFFLGFDSCVQIDIYCSQSVSWKQLRAPGTRIRHKAFCGGVVHWLCDDNVLFGLDVDSEKMIEMPSPPIIYSVYMIRYFGECDGRLILIETQTPLDTAFTILEMDKDCRSWIVKCLVDIGALQSVYPQLGAKYGYSVLCVVKGEKEEDFALVLAIGGKVISYKLECKTWKILCDVAYGHLYLTAYPYIQNLSPV